MVCVETQGVVLTIEFECGIAGGGFGRTSKNGEHFKGENEG